MRRIGGAGASFAVPSRVLRILEEV